MPQVNKYLYHTFDHWFRGGNIWIYSDPHFADSEMVYLRKNYIDDDEQVKRINSKVGKNDTIIFLGDMGNVEYINKIKGYKVLITGNHDSGKTTYMEYFNEVYDGPLMISAKVMLSHEPVDCPYFFSIHGHDHSNWFDNDHHFNACAEHINYTPVSLLDMFKKGMFKNVNDIHRMIIDRATERKAKRLANKETE